MGSLSFPRTETRSLCSQQERAFASASIKKKKSISVYAESTEKFCAVGRGGREPMFTIPWVGKAG